MPTWKEATRPKGEYISEPFDISNSLDKYVAIFDVTKINIHYQTLDFFYSVSYDGINWTLWKSFNEESSDLLSQYKLSSLYFKYKVTIQSEDDSTKPYLQSIKMTLEPFHLFENMGDLHVKPKLWIRKRNGRGNITLINHMTGQTLEVENLHDNEEVFIDCEEEEIISSFQNSGIYRYDDHNDEWLEFDIGESYLRGIGDFDMDIRFQNKFLQE